MKNLLKNFLCSSWIIDEAVFLVKSNRNIYKAGGVCEKQAYLFTIFHQWKTICGYWQLHWEGQKGSSFFGAPAKKSQNLRPAASKVKIQRVRHHQDSEVVTHIDLKLWTTKVTNQKTLISEKAKWKKKSFTIPSFNYFYFKWICIHSN